MYRCVWDMCMHMCTCIWTHTTLDTDIRAYEWTHAMLMHISTFTYTQVPRGICWHKHSRYVYMHTYDNFHGFAHMYVCCPYVHVYVNMYTHGHMYIVVHMYNLKWSKQSIDLCSNNILIPSAIFISIILATESLFSITHSIHFNLAEP